MENRNEKNGFSYTYSAKERAELERIRNKYAQPPAEDTLERLRRLDGSVTKTAQAVALILGICGMLIMGFGMSLVMTQMWEILGMSRELGMILGIAIGLVGAAVASIAYPVYHLIVKKKRERIAPEILRLTDELLK
ncbi:MAG: hypothetical protein E7643_04395 [Ruminococcaceae bacterium]|nr:hypothetical protein [Oscillospiraceae bacterium]